MGMTPNLTPEQQAREKIDKMLNTSGWINQNMDTLDFSGNIGIAAREYQTEAGFADYVLFINRNPVRVVCLLRNLLQAKPITIKKQYFQQSY